MQRAGPSAVKSIEEAGAHGGKVAKLWARHGEDAIWITSRKNSMAIFLKFGDEAGDAMIKHGEIADTFISAFGEHGAKALCSISSRNARRMSIMSESGTLKSIGRSDELLAVIGKHGDRAADFVWRSKDALAVAATLTTFLADPKPFVDGILCIPKTTASQTQASADETGLPEASSCSYRIALTCGMLVLFVLLTTRLHKSLVITKRSIQS